MRGMDDGPWTGLGTLGWFLGVWIVMMAAMMFPSVVPTVALYSRMTRERSPLSALALRRGLSRHLGGRRRARVRASRSPGAGSPATCSRGIARAGGSPVRRSSSRRVYELTPFKDVCLGKCRSPLGALLGSWRGGRLGALRMGAKNGAWCVGCCWALMASLFALGVMSITWMAFVAGLIAAEKTLPWRRVTAYATAAILLALAVLLLVAPDVVPALTIPGHGSAPPMEMPGS